MSFRIQKEEEKEERGCRDKNNDTACLPVWPRVEQRTDLFELCIHVKEEQMEEEGGRVPDNPEILRSSILS